MNRYNLRGFSSQAEFCLNDEVTRPRGTHAHKIGKLLGDIELGESVLVYHQERLTADKITAQSKGDLVSEIDEKTTHTYVEK